MEPSVWNFEQESGESGDETDINLRAYFDLMPDEKMLGYRADWSDEQTIAWDDNFRDDGNLMLLCSEREVDVHEYRRVLQNCIAYRNRVRAKLTDTQPIEMNNLSNTVAAGFIANFQDFASRVEVLARKLSEEQFWLKPYSYGNSFGNLVLHITGNLNYYVGATIANTGYVRERDLEFAERHTGKEEALRKLDEAVAMVIETLGIQTSESWEEEYQAIGVDDVKNRFGLFLRCAVHFHHHIGQMIYLVKELSNES